MSKSEKYDVTPYGGNSMFGLPLIKINTEQPPDQSDPSRFFFHFGLPLIVCGHSKCLDTINFVFLTTLTTEDD